MAKDTLTLALNGEDVPLADFAKAINGLLELVEALRSDVAGDVPMEWVIDELHANSAVATVRAVSTALNAAPAIETVVRAYRDLSGAIARGTEPAFSRAVRSAARDITSVVQGRVDSVAFITEDGAEVFSGAAPAVLADEPSFPASYGAVRGRIDTVTKHERLRFTLYESNTGRAVYCYLQPESRNLDLMREMWGKLASVEGLVQRDRASGRALNVRQVSHIQAIPEMEPGGWRAARGAAPEFAGNLLPEHAVGRGRDE